MPDLYEIAVQQAECGIVYVPPPAQSENELSTSDNAGNAVLCRLPYTRRSKTKEDKFCLSGGSEATEKVFLPLFERLLHDSIPDYSPETISSVAVLCGFCSATLVSSGTLQQCVQLPSGVLDHVSDPHLVTLPR